MHASPATGLAKRCRWLAGHTPLKAVDGGVEFEGIKFSYEHRDVFDCLSLKISPRQKVGLVGISGAGKTTLVNLLLRQFEVQGGSVKIDGQDIRKVTKESLSKSIAMVPQESFLFSTTIAENIRFGKPEGTLEELCAAAKGSDYVGNIIHRANPDDPEHPYWDITAPIAAG